MEFSLLDTDIFSEALRGRDAKVRAKSDSYIDVFGCFTISVITVSELIDGFRRQLGEDRIIKLLDEIDAGKHEVVTLGLKAARLAGYILGDLHRIGQPIGRSIHRRHCACRRHATRYWQHGALSTNPDAWRSLAAG